MHRLPLVFHWGISLPTCLHLWMWDILQEDVIYIIPSCGHQIPYPCLSLYVCAFIIWLYFLLGAVRLVKVGWSVGLLPILPPPHILLRLLSILSSTSCCPLILSSKKSSDFLSVYLSPDLFDICAPYMHTLCFPLASCSLHVLATLCGITEIAEWLYGATQTVTHDRT